jgi:hypothetical protein
MCRLKHKNDKKRHFVSVFAKANTFSAGKSERVELCYVFALIKTKKCPDERGDWGSYISILVYGYIFSG